METIGRLRTLLFNVTRGIQNVEQDLFDELMVHKASFLTLFDHGGRSQQEQRELESGKIALNGRTVAVNADFTRQVLFLAQQLEVSERYIASLMHAITTDAPNLEPVDLLEATVSLFHQRRRELAQCLGYLLQIAEAAEASNTPSVFTKIWDFVQRDLFPVPSTPTQPSLSQRIVKELQNLGNAMAKADAARKGARTATVAPSAQATTTPPALGFECLNSRYESFKFERRTLAACVSTIARLGYLVPNEIKILIDWICATPNQSLTYYLLTTVLSVFDPAAPGTPPDARHAELLQSDMMTYMSKKLAVGTEWKEPGLKATVLLKWTLFLTEARHRNAELEHRSGFKTEELETQIWNAVQGDAFTYLALLVAQIARKLGTPVPSLIDLLRLSPEQQDQRETPADDFVPEVLAAFEILVRSLLSHAASELRKIKQRQEDLVLAGARADRSRAGPTRFASTHPPENPSTPPRNDIAMLYSFVGLLYSALPPERALQFWGSTPIGHSHTYMEYVEGTTGKLPTFLQWAVWSTQATDSPLATSLYDMLNGLAHGQQCSELAHNFMARGGGEIFAGNSVQSSPGGQSVSWSVVFSLLESWTASNTPPRHIPPPQPFGNSFAFTQNNAPPPPPQPQAPVLGPKDVFLAQAFLRLLSSVVTHSVAVRKAIASHVHFRAIPTLVSLIPLGIPLEIKGALFDTLAAFCEPGAGAAGLEICRSVWVLMERHEVINVRQTGTNLPPVKGVELELDEIEATHRMYPSTIPFLRLLGTLLHTPKRIPLKDRLDASSINTVPDTLGAAYRPPGIGPFVHFVVDNVFANIPNREYLHPSDRWQTNDLCLCFIERALAGLDLESLVRATSDAQLKGEMIMSLVVHPGFDILKRILTGSSLQKSLLTYIVEGVAGFDKGLAEEEPYFGSTIIRVLRIIHRVLEVQDIFLDVLLPILYESENLPFLGNNKLPARAFFTKLDQALSYNPQLVPAIAVYVVFEGHPELVLLSVKIVSILASSSALAGLHALIQRSEECDRIMAGFARILETDSLEDVLVAESVAEQSTGAGAPDTERNPNFPALQQAVRLSVLQFFIRNTQLGKSYPNVAHFFLFGNNIKSEQQGIQDPHALGAHRTCVHVIFELANMGVPRLETDAAPVEDMEPLFIMLPGLAELVYRIIYQLCMHPRTSEFTMRYLRTRDDFFARQLAVIPSRVPETINEGGGGVQVVYVDGARVQTTVPALTSFLRLRAWIFDLVALDLHVLTSKGHLKGVAELLHILFGNSSADGGFREVGQSHLRIIEFAQSLAFDWADGLDVQPVELRFLGTLNLHSCIRKDASGCEIIDRVALMALLTTARRALNAQGSIVTPANAEQLDAEFAYILESCAIENHRREVAYAKSVGYESWKRLLDITLAKCFSRLPHEYRENMLFDLLHVLPAILRADDHLQESTAILLAEAVLSAVTKLREDRRHQILVQSANGDADAGTLPAERLYGILRSILECIVDNNRVELVRGNLYAAVINYVHLITPEDGPAPDLRGSLSMSVSELGFSVSEHSQALVPSRAASLELGSLSLMKPAMERLVTTISRDAIDGSEVWKTVAFMLLDSLVQLSGQDKQHVALSTLVRQGILTNFVRGVKESDVRLQSVLKPDPDDLNPLYVYEAKMSLFIRMAQTRAGAERLLEAQLIPILSQCDYLDARPEADQSFMDRDSFLPSAIQRYHQLLMPALQLVDGMLATLGTKHATACNQALEFLASHSATIVIMLKNDVDRQIPLAFVEEMHLVVSLCVAVLPHVPKAELSSPHSGFGAIHGAVLALATKCLASGRWLADISPQTDVEMLSASVLAIGHGAETKFDIQKRQKERLMRKCIVEYLGTASEFTEPEITPLLSPIVTAPRQEERGPHFLATIPTVGDALEALSALCGDLSATLQQIADITAELAAKEHVSVERIDEMLPEADAAFLRGLDVPQKRALVARELVSEQRVAEGEARTLVGTAEMLLLLLWRHVLYYAEGGVPAANTASAGNGGLKASTATAYALRFLAAPDPETFRAEIGARLAPVLGRLAGLELNGEWLRGSAAYVEIMSRRLRDSVGIMEEAYE
ncbi:Nucleoporin [Mycena chlorophos]|uniref:Nucleoporin n=1 Tax=Mycena chlorophos TaxID=658473 RepID=A0A8H6WQK1_MYCCL|nr:Nucleoporin [Mycena chlorophos]